MIGSPEDRSPPMTPQLALRVAMVGSFALVMFAIIFFRLWFLQVLSGNTYVAEANANIVQTIKVQAPRGQILDRNGNVLVSSDQAPAVLIAPQSLPKAITLTDQHAIDHPPKADLTLYGRLATLLALPNKETSCPIAGAKPPPLGPKGTFRMPAIACTVAQKVATQVAFSDVTLATGISPYLQDYMLERSTLFRGVQVEEEALRQYPLGDVGAQLFGTVGQISCNNPKLVSDCETRQARFKGAGNSDSVGQSGLEWQYNQYLQGHDGTDKVKVNAQGAFEGYEKGTASTAGETLKLSIDEKLEEVGQAALARSVAAVPSSLGGAFVAMNPDNGQVYAMGSNPTYNPSLFTKPISTSTYNQDFKNNPGNPLLDKAIESVGPDGSTFKVITSTAALESGAWTIADSYDDTGEFCFPPDNTPCLNNAGHAAYGSLDLTDAIKVSDDVFFYHLGFLLNADPTSHPNGGALQYWARMFGIGQSPGIDLPGAATGSLPTPKLLKLLYKEEVQCENATGPYKGHPKHPASTGGCGIANNSYWTVGDNVNTAVGQGDVQVSPLQLAVVYSALANGGNVVTPHVGMDIQSSNGTVLQKIDPPIKRHLNINPTDLGAILEGLHEAAQGGGTSSDVMGNFNQTVYGKTGTAQYIPTSGPNAGQETDYAWYACFVPATATSKPIAVVVWVQQGGFGDVSAAPVARQILSQWFDGRPGPYVAGTSSDV